MSRVALATLLLVGPVLATVEAEATDAARCYTIWVAAEGGPSSAGLAARRRPLDFGASEILDLRFLVLLPGNRNIDHVSLKLFTPKGHLYQELRIPLQPEPEPRPRWRSRFRWASVSMPVAGTTIVTSSLYGRWRAEAYVEGSTSPCTRARPFSIAP